LKALHQRKRRVKFSSKKTLCWRKRRVNITYLR
jgi:hypothetical protein